MNNKLIAVYALGGASKQYIALDFWVFYDGYSTGVLRDVIKAMVENNPSIKEIYQVDARYEYKLEYQRSRKKHDIESCAIFKDLLVRDGIKVYG